MNPDQAQTQSPQPGQPIREGQIDKDEGPDGNLQDESQGQGHLMEEGDGIPGDTEEGEDPVGTPVKEGAARRDEGSGKAPE